MADNPRTAEDGGAVSGFPEPPGKDPGNRSKDRDPHHSLNNPVGDAETRDDEGVAEDVDD
jgi:hypothetical protein